MKNLISIFSVEEWQVLGIMGTFFALVLTIIFSTLSHLQTTKIFKETNRPNVTAYLIFRRDNAYIKIKNFGNQQASIESVQFETNLKEMVCKNIKLKVPFSTCPSFELAPNQSRISTISKDLDGVVITIKYSNSQGNRKFQFRASLNWLGNSVLIDENDYNLQDY